MKQRLILAFIVLFFFSNAQAQTGWRWLNPRPQGNHLSKVQVVSASVVYATGVAGTILKTANGGSDWNMLRSRTNLSINGLHMVHPDSGFVVGDSSLVLKTINGGKAWFRQNTPGDRRLFGVRFLTSRLGWVCGETGTVLKTQTGGLGWQAQNSQTTNALKDITFISDQIGWVVGKSGVIRKTTDGGGNWQIKPSNTTKNINSVFFLSSNFGVAAGDSGLVLKTIDAGETWTTQPTGADDLDFQSVWATNIDTLFVAGGAIGQNPIIAQSIDGGGTWGLAGFTPESPVSSISLLNNNLGFAVGETGTLIKTEDGFQGGQNLRSGTLADFGALHFFHPDSGLVAGSQSASHEVYKTTDGGANWGAVSLGVSLIPFDLQFTSALVGYLCGSGGKVLKSNDRGDNWMEPGNTGTTQTLWGLHFLNGNIGLAVGSSGTIIKTINGGTNWAGQASATGAGFRLSEVALADANVAYIVGENGIQKTINGGSNWATQTTGDTMYSLHIFNPLAGIAVGKRGLILKTLNGGSNWNQQDLGLHVDLHKVHFSSPQQGMIVGDSGLVLRTTDGGLTWIPQISYNRALLNTGYLINDTAAYIAGDKGAILKTTTGGSTCPDALFHYTGVFLPGKFCEDDTLTQSLYFDGTPGGTFSATPPGLNLDPTSGIIKPWLSTPGSYTVQYQVTPPNGCPTQTFQTTALVQQQLFIPRARLVVKRPEYALPPQTVYVPCKGDTLLTRARNQFANLGFAWYRDNNLMQDTTQEIKVSRSGMYAVKYRDQACAGPFYDTVQIDFEDAKRPRKPDIQLTSPPVSCNDDFTLSSPTASIISFEWVDEFGALIPGQTGNTLNQNRVGTYRIQVDSLGCKNISEPITILPVGADTVLPTLYTVSTKGTDVPSEKNEVRWNRQNYDTSEVKRVVVYRAAETDLFYSPVAEIPATDSLFIDPTAVPGGQAFSYKISAKQLCGTELFFTPSSDLQNSIHLDISNHPPNHFILRWSEPLGYLVRKYRVLRGLSYDNLSVLADSLAGTTTSYMDDIPAANTYFYRIEAETDQAYSPWGRIAAAVRKTASNTRNTTLSFCDSCYNTNGLVEKVSRNLTVFPNPSQGKVTLSGFIPGEMITLQIVSSLGRIIHSQTYATQGTTKQLQIQEKGLFHLIIYTAAGRYTMRLLSD